MLKAEHTNAGGHRDGVADADLLLEAVKEDAKAGLDQMIGPALPGFNAVVREEEDCLFPLRAQVLPELRVNVVGEWRNG